MSLRVMNPKPCFGNAVFADAPGAGLVKAAVSGLKKTYAHRASFKTSVSNFKY
jgi:hypothetical protein